MAPRKKRESIATIIKERSSLPNIGMSGREAAQESLTWDDIRNIYRKNCWNTYYLEMVLSLIFRSGMTEGNVMLSSKQKRAVSGENAFVFWFGEDLCITFDIGNLLPVSFKMSRYDDFMIEMEFGTGAVEEDGHCFRVKACLGEECISENKVSFLEHEANLNAVFNKALLMCPALIFKQDQ